MASDADPTSLSTKDCMKKIDKIIENALGNESSETNNTRLVSGSLGETRGRGDYTPSTSPVRKTNGDLTKIVFSPVRDNYPGTKSSNALSGMGNGESPMKRYDLDAKSSTKDSFPSNAATISRFAASPDVSDNWVNYQFERLVTDRKNNPKNATTNQSSIITMHQAPKVKNVEDILREYSGGDPMTSKNYYSGSSSSINSYKIGLMNRSHNNETLDYGHVEMDQMRRVGSSVDGDVGDVLKSFGAKCSLSGTRCSGSQMSQSEENKSLGVHRDSEVDFKPPPTSSGRVDLSEIRTDLTDLNHSFQRERERLRHLETLIRKTPGGSSTAPEAIHTMRTHNYSSRFLNDYSGRRAYSVADYSKYGGSDWRSQSPAADYLSRANSSMSYKNLGIYSPSRTNYVPDYNPPQFTSSGYDMGRGPAMNTKYETNEHEPEPVSHSSYNFSNYPPHSSGSSSFSKTKLNRSYNAKKDRNMSSSHTETHAPKRKSSFMKSFNNKKTNFDSRRYYDNQDNRLCDNFKMDNKSRNKTVSPNSSTISDMFRVEPKKSVRPKMKSGKFQPYQPFVTQEDDSYPKRTKSEISTFENAPWSRQYTGINDNEPSADGEYNPLGNRWVSALSSSDFASCPGSDSANGMPVKGGNRGCNPVQQHTVVNKKGKKTLRSKSECRVPNTNVSGWSLHHQDQLMAGNKTSQTFRVKSSGRKLKPKLKKGTTTKQKKMVTKRK